MLAHLVTGRYGDTAGETRAVRFAAPAKASWFSRLIALFGARR